MDNQVSNENLFIDSTQKCRYTLDELLLLLNPQQCMLTDELLKKIPKKIATCCGMNQCNYHPLLCHQRANITKNEPIRHSLNKKKTNNEQQSPLPGEIIIAEVTDESDDSERSAEHSQHCCIHKKNVKISFDDLVRYKTRKTQPPYLAHENAVVNPKHITNSNQLENIIPSKSSEQLAPSKTKPLTSRDEVLEPNNVNETPFSRILKKIKEKGLVPKPFPQTNNQPQYQNAPEDSCPVHHKCYADVSHNANPSALTDNFRDALSMIPPALRRKLLMTKSNTASTSSDCVPSSSTSHGIPENCGPIAPTVNLITNHSSAPSSLQGKTIVPSGTLEKILQSNRPSTIQPYEDNVCHVCTCHQRPLSHRNSMYDEIIDVRQLERMQFNKLSSSVANSSSMASSYGNKENQPQKANEEDNLNFKKLVKQALSKDNKSAQHVNKDDNVLRPKPQ